MTNLQGKVALVTGAASGIGAATATLLSQAGARVIVADIDEAGAERHAATLQNARGRFVDLADQVSIETMIDETLAEWGRLDILHNNAADLSAGVRDADIETMDLDVWDRAFSVNVRGTMLCCKLALPAMVRQGGGVIINTASNLGLQGHLIQAAYSASKAAVIQMTRSIATSHGKRGIRCNAVLPGLTLSPSAEANLPAELREIVLGETLTPYLGRPDDIAHTVLFLASDEARYITGQIVTADGGTSIHVPGFARFSALFG
jgi:NAD(P)-dependent dehydrogenase (short-subunit alcohol dehydrogenase family)